MKKEQLQQQHWVDLLVADILEWQKKNGIQKLHVDDMKTPSGRVHVGALRGVVLHDVVAKALAQQSDQDVVSTYVFNDMDNMDGLPHYMNQEEYNQHMGKSLYTIPAPQLAESGIDFSSASKEEKNRYQTAESMGEFYALDFIDAFRAIGCSQEIVWSHKLYQAGDFDAVVIEALNSIDTIREIYKQVADYELPESWYPYQVRCEQCGLVGSTLATEWDGEYLHYECLPNKVEWAHGCGNSGKVKPTKDAGKLLWKVDWPAHWKVLGVTIEGAGKDHSTDGGSRDMAQAICEQVFAIPEPFDIPYEWILLRGAKMSSSKGVGTSAREFVRIFPSEVARFLFVNKHYNQVIDFDPNQTMAIPDLYDEYDQGARIFWNQEEGDSRLGRSYELSQTQDSIPQPHFLPRFRDIAQWLQYPEFDVHEKAAEAKGSALTPFETEVLESRISFAQLWVESYAPDEYQLTPLAELPAQAVDLSAEQVSFAISALEATQQQTWDDPQDLQQHLFDTAKASIGARAGFKAIYLSLIGKTHGPRAAWLLLSLDENMVKNRITQLQQLLSDDSATPEFRYQDLSNPDLISIDAQLAADHPDTVLGFAIIRGVNISRSNPKLEQEKQQVLEDLGVITRDTINEIPEVQAYRELYKSMRVKYQSRRPSPEALLRRVADGKELYTVNTCVDAYNLAVLKNKVSVGAFDISNITFPTQLKYAAGGEQILLLGDSEPTTIKEGEICYFDQQGAYNLDFNYRDAQRTSVTEQTTDLMINVDGVNGISREQVEQTLADSISLITQYCGGTVEVSGVVVTP